MKEESSNEIRVLEFPQSIRTRPGMYIGDVSDTTQLLTELIGNIQDEVSACSTCNSAIIDQNWNGYQVCIDSGRGMPIEISRDKPGQTSMEVALTNIHAGSKFGSTSDVRVGQNGCGLKAIVACSERFIMMSRITPDNCYKSIPLVKEVWDSYGPRSKKDLYYILVFEKGYKVFEGADKLENLEKKIFSDVPNPEPLPRGYSTIAMFRGDPEIFESTSSKLPLKSLQYFLLIQEKLYKRKIELIVNREPLNGTFKPYRFEMFKTIIPADTSKNKSVSVYATFEVDPELGAKQETGSVAGLNVDQGVHIGYIESCYEAALKNEFKIKHKYITTGLRLCVLVIAEDVVFNSQTKEKLKAISKVKLSDFGEITKEFQKIFKANPEYWAEHVGKLDYLAESMKSLSTDERVAKMIDDTKGGGSAFYKSKNSIVEGYAAASAGPSDRWGCELFLTEGLSPFGSLKSARLDIKHTGVLALRGKVKNLSKAGSGVDSLLDNKEYYSIFKVLNLGVGDSSVIKGCKTREEAYEIVKRYANYSKVIIATDSDEDG